jgi:hypothetical protein
MDVLLTHQEVEFLWRMHSWWSKMKTTAELAHGHPAKNFNKNKTHGID